LQLLSYQEHVLFGSCNRLEQPDGPVGPVSQVLVTHRMSAYRPDLLSVRGSIELLVEMIVLGLKVIILAKQA
jgi:hypothetical protein